MDSSLTSATECSTSDVVLPDDIPTLKALVTIERARNADLTQRVATSVPMILAYQQYIPAPPVPKEGLWAQACSGDKVTSESWRDIWMRHIENNVAEFKADENMVDQHYGKFAYGPAIIAGSGPSLKKNVDVLAKECPKEIPIVSCLHNFGFFIDKQVPCDYFVTLDAGDVVVPEMYEGGGSASDRLKYQKASESKTLIAGLVSPPELLRNWKGKIVFFNATIPDMAFMEKLPKVTKNKWVYSVGGNTLGACFYHAAYIFGCNPVALVGADFSFDYMHKFHSWDSPYDAKFQGLVPCTDVWGNRVYSWQSYVNFASWFTFQAMGGQAGSHLQMVNCTEGGILGAYPDGNIMSIKQLRLFDFLDSYTRWKSKKKAIDETDAGHYTVMC
jgi:hypothetical protein